MAGEAAIRQGLVKLYVVEKLLVGADGIGGIEEEDIAVELGRRGCRRDIAQFHGRVCAGDEVVIGQGLAVEKRNGDGVILPEGEHDVLGARRECKFLIGNYEGI